MSIQLTILFLSQCHFVTLSLTCTAAKRTFLQPLIIAARVVLCADCTVPFPDTPEWQELDMKGEHMVFHWNVPQRVFSKMGLHHPPLISQLPVELHFSCVSCSFPPGEPSLFPCWGNGPGVCPRAGTEHNWLLVKLVPRAAGAKLLPGNHRTLLAHQAVSGQVCFAERLFLRASVWWGRECQGHHCIVSLGRKLFTSVWEMGFQMAPSFKCSLCCVLCAEHWLPQACGDPRLMRCDPRNTGQVCLALIANDRVEQEELTVIFNFFSSPSCLWDYSPYPQRVGSSKWDLCFPKLPF